MIKVERHRIFGKYYKKLTADQRGAFHQKLKLFCDNPQHPLLRLHRLNGDLNHFYSFSVGGDLRVHFEWSEKNRILLHKIGTHSQLYK